MLRSLLGSFHKSYCIRHNEDYSLRDPLMLTRHPDEPTFGNQVVLQDEACSFLDSCKFANPKQPRVGNSAAAFTSATVAT